jgi:hypothetical protein
LLFVMLIHKFSISLVLFSRLLINLKKSLKLVPTPFNFWGLLEAQQKKVLICLVCVWCLFCMCMLYVAWFYVPSKHPLKRTKWSQNMLLPWGSHHLSFCGLSLQQPVFGTVLDGKHVLPGKIINNLWLNCLRVF